MLSMALQEAVTKLKAQERATAARAEASERLASQIVEGLTSGLVVVDRAGDVQTLNPAAGRILGIADDRRPRAVSRRARHVAGAGRRDRRGARGRRADRATHGCARWSRPKPVASWRHRLADYRRGRRAAGGGLPLYRPDGGGGARRAAAPQGGAGAAGRAHRGTRARVPERPGDHPRLRAPARSRPRCQSRIVPTSRAFAQKPPRLAKWSPTSCDSRARNSW